MGSHHILAICFDQGDTLVDEATEVKDDGGATLRADLIPGAAELLHTLRARGYRLALIADGPPATFRNVLGQHGLYELFDVVAVSGELGVEKPDARIFHHALGRLGIPAEEYGRTMMVGNNLGRDVKGANSVGMISVWLDWAPRRAKVPRDESEAPQCSIRKPLDLLPLLESLEEGGLQCRSGCVS